MKSRVVIAAAAAVFSGLCCADASAAALSGTFNMSGIVTVTDTSTTNTITWQSDAPGNAADMFTLTLSDLMLGATSINEDGQNGIANLNENTQPVGSVFAAVPFITFDVVPAPNLNINFIQQGSNGSADCFTAPAVGQHCSLPGSPFNFENDAGGAATPIVSVASWSFSGVTSDGLSQWTAVFDSHFNTPYQTVLANFSPGGTGTETHSYSAESTIVVTPIGSVPEPGTMALMGLGMVLVSAGLRRRLGKKV